MKTSTSARAFSNLTVTRAAIALNGLVYLFSGAALLFAPSWFFNTIGNFPPFNRHYSGDLGAFLLPLGAGLLIAARQPSRHRGLIAVAAGAALLHALNHGYDALGQPLVYWLTDTLPLLALAVLLIQAYRRLPPLKVP